MNAVASTQAVAGWHLSQRVMIFCPHTGLPVHTRHALTDIGDLVPRPQMLIDCVECGEDHSWLIEDAFLE